MLDLLNSPMMLAVVIGPIAGVIWTNVLNRDARSEEQNLGTHTNVIGNGDISATEGGNVQIGHGNQVTNNNFNGGQPAKSQTDGEPMLFGIVGVIAAIIYIRNRDWAIALSVLALLFNVAFTLFHSESGQTKLLKSLGYSALAYTLYLVIRSPLDPHYISVVKSLKGQGLNAYIEAVRLGDLPFSIIFTAMYQAGALFISIFVAHTIRTTPASRRIVGNVRLLCLMVLAVMMPLYMLNFEVVNEHVVMLIGEAI